MGLPTTAADVEIVSQENGDKRPAGDVKQAGRSSVAARRSGPIGGCIKRTVRVVPEGGCMLGAMNPNPDSGGVYAYVLASHHWK